MKNPRSGSPVQWHQDWAFYPHTNDDLLAVGIALDDMRIENSCMMVVPGSHTGPVYDHHQDGDHHHEHNHHHYHHHHFLGRIITSGKCNEYP